MTTKPMTIDALDRESMAELVADMCHRLLVHHAFWFNEVRHQLGPEKAMAVFASASRRSAGIQMNRLGKLFGFEVRDGLPAALWDMSPEKLLELMDTVAVNWLANDGVWFQAMEFNHGMNDAKRCNDTCWGHFSPYEAWSIKQFLGLPEKPGLEGLKQALNYRIYARINEQSFVDEESDQFVFQMNACRVQMARKRKGLDDYPCKSGGLVEYTYFARTIDDRIVTECVGCPPDTHPADWFCSWRFKLKETK